METQSCLVSFPFIATAKTKCQGLLLGLRSQLVFVLSSLPSLNSSSLLAFILFYFAGEFGLVYF